MTIFLQSGKIGYINQFAAGSIMQTCIPFDPYNNAYKFPFGSVAAGSTVYFAVCLPRPMGCTGVSLLVREAFSGREAAISLQWRETDGIVEWWNAFFTPPAEGLYYYAFEYHVSWGKGEIGPDETGVGAFSANGGRWQLTVYEPDYKTPDWLKGGLIYQIFPDRFYASGQKKDRVPKDRILRTDRENPPIWQPDADGVIRNNDFFGGDLKGIEEKLPYLESLGVTCIYLNPIFEAYSNHRYDTAD